MLVGVSVDVWVDVVVDDDVCVGVSLADKL